MLTTSSILYYISSSLRKQKSRERGGKKTCRSVTSERERERERALLGTISITEKKKKRKKKKPAGQTHQPWRGTFRH